ncbi:hypothetical protein CN613_25535 [Bacillus pseudomycoides]|uniref:Uncharacterized protein n=1 Tax=Bacillus pseudomycoides TaxID=64104 RepID=A0A2A8BYB6_9BACI|nr:hypothetical protein [Bacillus pseudomycoides]PEM65309.1 hypothetical protein CN613_25535 [Bacillus pseudomycoides]
MNADIKMLMEFMEKRFDAIDEKLEKLDIIHNEVASIREDVTMLTKDSKKIKKDLQFMKLKTYETEQEIHFMRNEEE